MPGSSASSRESWKLMRLVDSQEEWTPSWYLIHADLLLVARWYGYRSTCS